jgi:putative FmdB family regulatory protein
MTSSGFISPLVPTRIQKQPDRESMASGIGAGVPGKKRQKSSNGFFLLHRDNGGIMQIMPTIEYQCLNCGHVFNRTVLKGDAPGSAACPKCHRGKAKPSTQSPRLFEGIASFSTLAKDTN